jgi:putative folate metabolism gamma-glutamate ligase
MRMKVEAIRTKTIRAGALSLEALLDEVISSLEDGSVVAITSKIVSLCENNVLPLDNIGYDDLVRREADAHLPKELSKYKHHFTIKNHTLIAGAGIDESNGDGHYILWPADSQKTANAAREYLQKKFSLTNVGIVITDSTCHPLRLGTSGICLAHSGFAALRDYIGKPDLFGRPFGVTQANIATGLSAAAVLTMGEGAESTPIAIITNANFIDFQNRDPSPKELELLNFDRDEDLFAPFLNAVDWQVGGISAEH